MHWLLILHMLVGHITNPDDDRNAIPSVPEMDREEACE